MTPDESIQLSVLEILLRLALTALIGGVIGYERRLHHKAIGVAGMMLVGIGSCSYMLLAKHLSNTDPAAISRAIQGILQGILHFPTYGSRLQQPPRFPLRTPG